MNMTKQQPESRWEPEDERTVTLYLLGELSEEARKLLEERYFSDDQFFEFVQAVEGRLMDDYLRGNLSEAERTRLEELFVKSHSLSRDLNFTKALMAALRESAAVRKVTGSFWKSLLDLLATQPRSIQVSLAASALVMLVAFSWLGLEAVRFRGRLNEIRSERASFEEKTRNLERQMAQEKERTGELASRLQAESEVRAQLEQQMTSLRQSRGLLLTFLLRPSMVERGGADQSVRLVIPRAVQTVRLQLFLPQEDAHTSFQAQLETQKLQQAWSQGGLQAVRMDEGKVIALLIPANVFMPGHYFITLRGVTAAGQDDKLPSYDFSVVRP